MWGVDSAAFAQLYFTDPMAKPLEYIVIPMTIILREVSTVLTPF